MALGFLQRRLAKQLGNPSGLLGNLVVAKLNERNYKAIAGAVAALELSGGETVADIGYGGGVGLTLLLDAVGEAGHVHGVEPSPSMIERARKELGEHVAGRRLALHEATMGALPSRTESSTAGSASTPSTSSRTSAIPSPSWRGS